MCNNLPDCMYDYRPDRFEDRGEDDNIYCERCADIISEQEYNEYGGYCSFCNEILAEEQ